MEYSGERHIGEILKERNIEIIGADPATRYGFTQVPNFILTKKEVSVGAKLAELQRNLDRLRRYDEKTLPLASAQADAALTAYRSNAGTLLAVAEANHRAVDTALERLALEAKTAKLWADLTFLVPLPTAQTEPAAGEFK